MVYGMEGNKMNLIEEMIQALEAGASLTLYREELIKVLKDVQNQQKTVKQVVESAVEPVVEPITVTVKEPKGKITVTNKLKKLVKA